MIVGIHQPNYIPWIGYFHKILASDLFVLIDQVQFVKGHVCNRNKIRDKNGREITLTVPVRMSKGAYQSFNEIEIDYDQKWQKSHLNLIKNAYLKADFFEEYFELFSEIINVKYSNLAELNIKIIKFVCDELQIKTPLITASEIPVDFGRKNEMNLGIVKHFGGTVYLSGCGGARQYNDERLFADNGVKIEYQQFVHPVYKQIGEEFIPNLSVLDLLFNCGKNSGYYLNANTSK